MVKTSMILTAIGVVSAAIASPALAQQAQPQYQRQQQTQPQYQQQQQQQPQYQQQQQPQAGTQGPSTISSTVSTSGKVVAIDRQAKKVTIQSAEGKALQVSAPNANLQNLKVGDSVDLEYRQALAVEVLPPGSPMAGPTEQTARQRTHGGGAAMREVSVTAEVVSVDSARNEVTFRGPRGNYETLSVQDPAMQERARQLKPGDKVNFRYIEAAAVSIRPKGAAQ